MKSEFNNKPEDIRREWDFEDAWLKAGAVKTAVSPPTYNSLLNNISSQILSIYMYIHTYKFV
jgi:hypothetical protein